MTDTKVTNILPIVQATIERHGPSKEELVPILSDINRSLGYLPKEALEEVSRLLKIPKSHVLSVASFYYMFSTKPTGKHIIKVCESAPCHVSNAFAVIRAIEEELGLPPNSTSQDEKWTFITTSCLGVCGVGPVMIIDDDIYGNVEPSQVPSILSKYQ